MRCSHLSTRRRHGGCHDKYRPRHQVLTRSKTSPAALASLTAAPVDDGCGRGGKRADKSEDQRAERPNQERAHVLSLPMLY